MVLLVPTVEPVITRNEAFPLGWGLSPPRLSRAGGRGGRGGGGGGGVGRLLCWPTKFVLFESVVLGTKRFFFRVSCYFLLNVNPDTRYHTRAGSRQRITQLLHTTKQRQTVARLALVGPFDPQRYLGPFHCGGHACGRRNRSPGAESATHTPCKLR